MREGVKVNVGVDEGGCVGVLEGVIVGVGVYDNSTMIRTASAVLAMDVSVALKSCVGVEVGVNVAVGVLDGDLPASLVTTPFYAVMGDLILVPLSIVPAIVGYLLVRRNRQASRMFDNR